MEKKNIGGIVVEMDERHEKCDGQTCTKGRKNTSSEEMKGD
jgi:hypothetical protein